MNKRYYLMLEAIMTAPDGLTREEINNALQADGFARLDRKRFAREIAGMRDMTHLDIRAHDCGKNVWRYRVHADTDADRNRVDFVHSLIANLWEAEFLSEFRTLGNRVQPQVIPRGNQYLQRIGRAMLEGKCMRMTYQKFVDTEPYDCTIQPYTLKSYQSRWYLLARKTDETVLKHFALDRIHALTLTDEDFILDATFDSDEYYLHCFGIWKDPSLFPQDVLVTTTQEQAHYFRTLPLHHSQQELSPVSLPDGRIRCRFLLHMCVTPDFRMEMKKYTGVAEWDVVEDDVWVRKNLSEERL